MPEARRYNANARHFTAPDRIPPRLTVQCPRCGALPMTRCFRLKSWVDLPGHRDGGFYTERGNTVHPARTAKRADPPGVSPREALRTRIRSLTQVKLSGSVRWQVRRWAESVQRTDEELAAKVAELEAMTNLSW